MVDGLFDLATPGASWLTWPEAKPGTRNAGIGSARVGPDIIERYEGRWDLLNGSAFDTPVLLPTWMREKIDHPKVGLPEGHSWRQSVQSFDAEP